MPHTELAELILDESGYTAMWQADKSPQAQSRLENLKELVRFMHEFDTPRGLPRARQPRHGRRPGRRRRARVAHDAARAPRAWSSTSCSCPAGRRGCSRTSAALDESGQAGLEEERRLAYVGHHARQAALAKVSFAQNRRNRGLYQSALPSRFVDELPEANVEVMEAKMPFGGAYQNFAPGPFGRSRFDDAAPFTATYDTPGWQRAQERTKTRAQEEWSPAKARKSRGPTTIEGELVAASSGEPAFRPGERVSHQKFGSRYGGRCRRQQADDRFRHGWAQARRRQFRRPRLSSGCHPRACPRDACIRYLRSQPQHGSRQQVPG